LDEIAVSASSRFEQTMEAPDSVFMAGDWSDISFRNGIKHNASASTQMRLGFVSITPSFQYNEFWAFQELNAALVEDETGAIQQVTDTLVRVPNHPGLASSPPMLQLAFMAPLNSIRSAASKPFGTYLVQRWGLSYTPELQRTQTVSLNDESYEFNPYSLNRFRAPRHSSFRRCEFWPQPKHRSQSDGQGNGRISGRCQVDSTIWSPRRTTISLQILWV
jgi:hypothetical protein